MSKWRSAIELAEWKNPVEMGDERPVYEGEVETMIPAIDTEYGQLLQEVQPKVIHTKKEHARQLQEIKRLMLKADKRTPAESALLGALATFVHEYELKRRPLENHTPAEMLEFMMEQHNKKSVDLPIPHTRVSEILSGKRSISKAQAIALGEFFHVSPVLFVGL